VSVQQPWGYGKSASPDPGMLASDAARERAVEVLNQAFMEGRLLPEEHQDRLGRAYAARTYGDLEALTRDIPRRIPAPAPQAGTNSKAIAAVVCGASGFFFGLPAPAAIVLGHMARREIRRTNEQGDGMAVAGLVMGYVMTIFMVGVLLLGVAMVAAVSGSGPHPG